MIKKVLSVVVCLVIVCTYLSLPASACTTVFDPWVYDASVSTTDLSVKFCSTAYRFHILSGTGVMVWNGISSNIHISSYTATTDSGAIDADINMFSYEREGDEMGRTFYYKRNNATGTISEVEHPTDTITQTRIVFNPALFELESAEMHKTVIHEIGHSLALMHPSCNSMSVMYQRNMPYEATTIQQHDRMTLMSKWGV